MLLIYNPTDLPGRPNERAISQALFDTAQYQLLRETLPVGYGRYLIDQTTLDTQSLAIDLFNTLGQTDFRGLGKYYIRMPAQTLWVRGGWRPGMTEYTPTQDVLVVPSRSAELASFADMHPTFQGLLAAIETGATRPEQAVRELAQAAARLENLVYRMLHPER